MLDILKKEGFEVRKIFFAGGGSGGHIYPNIALHQYLLEAYADQVELKYIVTKGSMEERLTEQNSISQFYLPFLGGMPRSIVAVVWLLKLCLITVVAVWRLSQDRPNVVFATGGYASASVLFACVLLRIPFVIHNLDSHFGLSNRVFAKWSSAITLGMPLNEKSLSSQGPISVVGNPVSEKFYQQYDRLELLQELGLRDDLPVLLVTGGSQGARIINKCLLELLPDLDGQWQIIHQLGSRGFEEMSEEISQAQGICANYYPMKYIDDLYKYYQVCDLAVARAGAMTLAEIAAAQVPSIIIPLPNLAQNHQYHNAKYYEDMGLATVLEQKDLSKATLKEQILSLYKVQKKLHQLTYNDAAKKITEILWLISDSQT